MKLTGTLINYYFHCKRQCYLASKRLNMEDNSEDVLIGKILHENKYLEDDNAEVSINNIKIDKITEHYIIEYKKSDSDLEAVKWQLIYYLSVLKEKGVIKKGKIIFEASNNKKIIYLNLTPEIENKLINKVAEIKVFLESDDIPVFLNKPHCRKCAYFNYCKI